MTEPTRIVEVLVGHSSSRLSGSQENGHTHKWTLFVKPVNKEYDDFPDNKLIQKVKFQIHDSFPNPIRNVSKPPFKISETGFASFSTYVTVYLNLPHQKPHTFPYELNLFTGDQDVQGEVQKLVIRGESVPTPFADLVKRYCKTKKRKASVVSPNYQKSSPESKKVKRDRSEISGKIEKVTREKEMHRDKPSARSKKPEESKDVSGEVSIKKPRIELESPSDAYSPSKQNKTTAEKKRNRTESSSSAGSTESAEKLTKKLKKCSDPYVVYKVSEFLLSLPKTTLSSNALCLSFDLSSSSQTTLSEISRLMKATKKAKISE